MGTVIFISGIVADKRKLFDKAIELKDQKLYQKRIQTFRVEQHAKMWREFEENFDTSSLIKYLLWAYFVYMIEIFIVYLLLSYLFKLSNYTGMFCAEILTFVLFLFGPVRRETNIINNVSDMLETYDNQG